MNVNRRSYYKWTINKSIINNYNKTISEIISEEHKEMNQTYGTIRLKYQIQNKYGLILNHKLIRRYKKALGLTVIVRTKKPLAAERAKEKNLKNKAPYLVKCNFKSDKFNRKQSTDVSYIKCSDGTLYLSAVKDYFNNEIVSYATSNNNDVALIKESFRNMTSEDNKIVNTDQGAVYFAYEYIQLAKELKFKRSMSHKGHCWENSPIENWFFQLKQECLYPLGKITKKQAKEAIKKYVQWYNHERIQKDLGYLTPIEYRLIHQN